jgi:hypothetical protein
MVGSIATTVAAGDVTNFYKIYGSDVLTNVECVPYPVPMGMSYKYFIIIITDYK